MGDLGATRVFGQHGARIVAIGLERRPMRDLYHWLVAGSWTRLILVYAAVYFATLALFAAARLLATVSFPLDGGSLLEALARAAETPPAEPPAALSGRGLAVAAIAALGRFFHWIELVIGAGIVYAKFSLVRARVLFSDVAVVAAHGEGRALMFRMANERTSHIVDAKVSVMLVRNEVQDGDPFRRAYDLDLLRGGTALFSHAWTAVHPIGRGSPLEGEGARSLEDAEAEVIVNLSGFDEALMRTVHARHVYPARRIRWGVRFREIVKQLPDGRHAVDYRKFHRTVPDEVGGVAERERSPRRAR